MFINQILKFWNIVNVKNTTKGIHKRLEDAKVISKVEDDRLEWLHQFSQWLKVWNTHKPGKNPGLLTRETFKALSHTVDTLVLLVKELLQHHKFQYILLGKFQTDNLEARFGQYRMLSGCNYLVSVNEVLQSEKKLKVKNLLKLYTESRGIIKIRNFFIEFSDPCVDKCDRNFVDTFLFNDVSRKVKHEDLPSLLYTAGYVARKAVTKTECSDCKEILGNKGQSMDLDVDEEYLQYTKCLDRGGLIYPSNLLFMIIQVAYNIFNMCVASGMEAKFIKVQNQRETLIAIIEHYITTNEDFVGIYYVCEICDTPCLTIIMKGLGCFANIMLNNYSKNNNDKGCSIAKQTLKKTAKLN